MRGRSCALILAAVAGLLMAAPAAQATFHEMSIREVYPGGSDNASYIELQMWAPDQQFVAGHHLIAYNPNGSVNRDFSFGSGVASGANQATILVADTSYASVFPGKPAPDASDAALNLSPAGGAVCWTEGAPPDCVAWGSFSGPLPAHVPPLLVGNPVSPGGVTAGKALQRTIAPNCATLLEPADDSDDSAADFSEQTPNPRNNASAIFEHTCPPPLDTTPPIATIDSHPADPSPGASAVFKYHSNETGSTFECSLVTGGPDSFSACPVAGRTYTNLADGSYVFKVRATDKATNQGLPVEFSWEVDNSLDTTPPETSIATRPVDPSSSSTAAFTYTSSEPGSTFECRLDGAAFAACAAAGVSYTGLGAGSHAFQVRAIDSSKNVDPSPAGYAFSVVLSSTPAASPSAPPQGSPPTSAPAPAPRPSPVQTTLSLKPAAKTRDRTPTFRFRSSAKATFQCKLDGGAFKPCSSPFTAKPLALGTHTLKIRAVSDGVPDPTPVSYTFKVVKRR